jgi:hypothetical protein
MTAGSCLTWDGTLKLGALHARACKQLVPWYHDVAAGITVVPHPTFVFGHQFEITALYTIRASGFLCGPKCGGKGHTYFSGGNCSKFSTRAGTERLAQKLPILPNNSAGCGVVRQSPGASAGNEARHPSSSSPHFRNSRRRCAPRHPPSIGCERQSQAHGC